MILFKLSIILRVKGKWLQKCRFPLFFLISKNGKEMENNNIYYVYQKEEKVKVSHRDDELIKNGFLLIATVNAVEFIKKYHPICKIKSFCKSCKKVAEVNRYGDCKTCIYGG
jgi:hypothetical protein